MGRFLRDTAVERIDEHSWQGQFTEDWCIHGVPNGGYVMAAAARALSEALPHKDPLTISAFYLTATRAAPFRCEVEILRCGGSMSQAMARIFQSDSQGNERLCVQLTAAFCDMDQLSGETLISLPKLDIPPPEDCVAIPPIGAVNIFGAVRARVPANDLKSMIGEPQHTGEWRGWLEMQDETPPDLFSMLFFADAFPPPVFTRYGPVAWVPTIELNVQLRARPSAGPIRARVSSKTMVKGILEEDGEYWDSQGQLIAISRQTAKFRLP